MAVGNGTKDEEMILKVGDTVFLKNMRSVSVEDTIRDIIFPTECF